MKFERVPPPVSCSAIAAGSAAWPRAAARSRSFSRSIADANARKVTVLSSWVSRSAPTASATSTAPARTAMIGALGTAPRRGERGSRAHAATDRLDEEHPRSHQAGEGGRAAPDGLWPPRLQELRPAREDHQGGGLPGVRGDGEEPADRRRAGAREDRARRRVLREAAA